MYHMTKSSRIISMRICNNCGCSWRKKNTASVLLFLLLFHSGTPKPPFKTTLKLKQKWFSKKVALARIAHCLAHNLYNTQSWVHVKISPEMIYSGWQGSKHQLTSHDKNSLSSCCIQVKCLSWGKRHPSLLRTAVHCDSVSGCNMTFFTDWFSKLVFKGNHGRLRFFSG